jgi:branched-chain amino acid transport system substrate-binding protein
MIRLIAVALLALNFVQPAGAQDIVVGQSVALSGADADIGRDMRDGAMAVFNQVNASKTLGHRIQLVTLDNANNRQRAADNTQQLLGQYRALVLFGYNSASNSLDALPLAVQNEMLFFAPFSGSNRLINQPNVYTIRASYKEEAAKIIEAKRTVGATKAVILYYDDEVGHANYETVASAFTDAGIAKPAGVAVKRGATLTMATVSELTKDAPHYVLTTTQYSVLSDLLRLAAQAGTPVSVAALSFVNPDELSESVGAQARGVIVSQVIPAPRAANQVSLPIVKECAEALKELNGASLNYTSLESCIAAKALVVALRHAGPNPTRESILHAMASFGHVDLGGFILHYSATDHQGSNWVELTMLSRGNRYVR